MPGRARKPPAKKRHLKFAATECGSVTQDGAFLCGASNSKTRGESHSLIFVEDDDNAPYFELDDQSQGASGLVKKVAVHGATLSIVLSAGQKNPAPYTSIEVDLSKCQRSSRLPSNAG